MKKNCQFIVWGPKLQAVWRNRGSANRPKMDQFENFSIIYCTKSKLKGGQFNEKNANSCILGPILWAVLDILGGLPIGPQSTDLKNFEQFPTQNPNSNGVCFMQKIANSCIWGPILRAVLKNGGSADRPRIGRLKKFSSLLHTKSELKGGLFYEKIC